MKEKIAKEKEELKKAEIIPDETENPAPEIKNLESQDSGIASETFCQEKIDGKEELVDESVTAAEIEEPANVTPPTESGPMQVDDESPSEEAKQSDEVIAREVKESEPVVQEKEKEEERTPFQELIRVASLLNPKQFDLPVEMTEPFPFPGTERVEQIKNGRRVKSKRLIELDVHGCVPLPAKLCYACSKSCKKAPLISCDYCTLFFHQDCLDPPMTALPAGRWMCPNHPQHFIVSKLFLKLSYYNNFPSLTGLEFGNINFRYGANENMGRVWNRADRS